jgi:hypothetical protein
MSASVQRLAVFNAYGKLAEDLPLPLHWRWR